ncbi:hypothetical protein L596_020587 [Steinernema carpocapsae]|uniref:Uncharacterized protein n=1 Tax=Steinernema carpocapsae TaxID=34508 RepID=A0A4U5MUR0_STECR|nr:hypothetical protein L596_020587 [Steinernema carpocapsae]
MWKLDKNENIANKIAAVFDCQRWKRMFPAVHAGNIIWIWERFWSGMDIRRTITDDVLNFYYNLEAIVLAQLIRALCCNRISMSSTQVQSKSFRSGVSGL